MACSRRRRVTRSSNSRTPRMTCCWGSSRSEPRQPRRFRKWNSKLNRMIARSLMSAATQHAKPLPAPNSDFYQLLDTLPAEDLAVVKQVRAFMEAKVAPIINKYWVQDAFPFELVPGIKELNVSGVGMKGYGCPGGSGLLFGLIAMERSRVDSSISTFFGDHNGLAMGS